MSTNQNYNILDITKFFMALLVVCIHIKILPNNEYVSLIFTNVIARVAVPFFFVCSGFLFFKKQNSLTSSALIKMLKRLLVLFIGWTVFFGVVMLSTEYYYTEERPFYRFYQFLLRHLILNPYFHLWFLPALMIGLSTSWFFIKYNLKKTGFALAIILYIIGLLGDSYYNLSLQFNVLEPLVSKYYSFFTTTRNGLFFGFPIIFLFLYLRKVQLSHKTNLFLSLFFFILLFLEFFLIKKNGWARDHNMYLSLIPFSKFFFDGILTLKIKLSKNACLFFREYSLGLYLIHPFWLITPFIDKGYIEVIAASLLLIFIIKFFKVPFLNNLLK